LGAKGDSQTDDTAVLQKAIDEHRAIYLPSGCYLVRDTLKLRPDTVLIGLHLGATQIILPDGTPVFQGIGAPKALIETPKGGSNIVVGHRVIQIHLDDRNVCRRNPVLRLHDLRSEARGRKRTAENKFADNLVLEAVVVCVWVRAKPWRAHESNCLVRTRMHRMFEQFSIPVMPR
jgi:hypothetical protein